MGDCRDGLNGGMDEYSDLCVGTAPWTGTGNEGPCMSVGSLGVVSCRWLVLEAGGSLLSCALCFVCA